MTEEEAKKEMKHFILGLTAKSREAIVYKGIDQILEDTHAEISLDEAWKQVHRIKMEDLDKYNF